MFEQGKHHHFAAITFQIGLIVPKTTQLQGNKLLLFLMEQRFPNIIGARQNF